MDYDTEWVPTHQVRFNADGGGSTNAKKLRVCAARETIFVEGTSRVNRVHCFLALNAKEALILAHHLVHAADSCDTNDSA